MPKDNEKYRYFNFGLLRDSWALEKFLEDAEKHHLLDTPGKLVGLRLTEYYELVEKGLISVGSIPTPGYYAPPPTTNGATPSGSRATSSPSTGRRSSSKATATTQDAAAAPVAESDAAEANADAALDYFSMDEDEEEEESEE